jgi:hypothetical protein
MLWTLIAVLMFLIGGFMLLKAISMIRFPGSSWGIIATWSLFGLMSVTTGILFILEYQPLAVFILAIAVFFSLSIYICFFLISWEDMKRAAKKARVDRVGWIYCFGRCVFFEHYIAASDFPFRRIAYVLGLTHFWDGFAVRDVKLDIGNEGAVKARIVFRATKRTDPIRFWDDEVQRNVDEFTRALRQTGIGTATRVWDYQNLLEPLYGWQPPERLTLSVEVQEITVYPPLNKICAPHWAGVSIQEPD